ncbi:cell division protein PerM [Allostreptomyces psammosilenae]|uniref:Integral membrane protein n=1 Tax=Allostreptomyces psammosilenae TaxID=1892865 RepID=A0A853A0Q6_9ACTN|nr:DUF6350 family protein [Allostreptomyces psammosilenae]NYI07959.1 hypothetical protein [Allostreptomyces psammosilenae]
MTQLNPDTGRIGLSGSAGPAGSAGGTGRRAAQPAPAALRAAGAGAGALIGAATACLGLLIHGLVGIGLWVASPYHDGTMDAALHTAMCLWFAGHGADLVREVSPGLPTVPASLTPLGLAVLPALLLVRSGRALAHGPWTRDSAEPGHHADHAPDRHPGGATAGAHVPAAGADRSVRADRGVPADHAVGADHAVRADSPTHPAPGGRGGPEPIRMLPPLGGLVLGYATTAVLVAGATDAARLSAPAASVAVMCAAVALLFAAIGACLESGSRPWRDLLLWWQWRADDPDGPQSWVLRACAPAVARGALHGACAMATALVGAGALLAAVALTLHAGLAVEYLRVLARDLPGGVAVTLLCLAAVPNAAAWGAAYLLGPGFAVGAGTSVSPAGVTLGPLPDFPLLAALPTPPGTAGGWAWAALAAPALGGVVAGAVVLRAAADWEATARAHGCGGRAGEGVDASAAGADGGAGCGGGGGLPSAGLGTGATAVAVLGAAVFAGVVMAVASWLCGGAMGDGRMAELGPRPWLVGVATGGWTAGAGLPTALLLRRRAAGGGEAVDGVEAVGAAEAGGGAAEPAASGEASFRPAAARDTAGAWWGRVRATCRRRAKGHGRGAERRPGDDGDGDDFGTLPGYRDYLHLVRQGGHAPDDEGDVDVEDAPAGDAAESAAGLVPRHTTGGVPPNV